MLRTQRGGPAILLPRGAREMLGASQQPSIIYLANDAPAGAAAGVHMGAVRTACAGHAEQ